MSRAYAQSYAALAWRDVDPALVDGILAQIGPLAGKRVLDLGGGPGQYSVELAKRGAHVLWHDVSRSYMEIARQRAQQAGVNLTFSLGYLEEARRFLNDPFDFVFCRVCWCYAADDRDFANLVYSLVKPEGYGYIELDTFDRSRASRIRRIQARLNSMGLKIGHPHPYQGAVQTLMQNLSPKWLHVSTGKNRERLIFVRGSQL